jgi:hypothetical protein
MARKQHEITAIVDLKTARNIVAGGSRITLDIPLIEAVKSAVLFVWSQESGYNYEMTLKRWKADEEPQEETAINLAKPDIVAKLGGNQ